MKMCLVMVTIIKLTQEDIGNCNIGLQNCFIHQWHNRWGGAECPPETSDQEIFADVLGKKGSRRKGKKVENLKWKQENVIKRGEDLFFLFLLFSFENDWNLFWVYQNGNFLSGKSISRREKNQEKLLCPLRKICLLRPCHTSKWFDRFNRNFKFTSFEWWFFKWNRKLNFEK